MASEGTMAVHRRITYTRPDRAYLEPGGRRHPHSVIEALVGTKLTGLEGEAVGFLLFGKELMKLREDWNRVIKLERLRDYLAASHGYDLLVSRILAADYLTPQRRIAAWLPRTKDGRFQTQGTVWNLLKRARARIGVTSDRELRGLVVDALNQRSRAAFDRYAEAFDTGEALRAAVFNPRRAITPN